MSEEQDSPYTIQGQYIKDLSFENPNPLESFGDHSQFDPEVSIGIEVTAHSLNEEVFEVLLDVQVTAKKDGETMFLVELSYGSIVTIGSVEKEMIGPLLMVHCPTMMFPFVRNIVAQVTRDGGYPPLYLSPVDFWDLYQERELGQEGNTSTTVN
jgi:preprotein translocase subunit SecB